MNRTVQKGLRYIRRHSSEILTGISIIGVAATAILAVKEKPKADERIKKAAERKGEILTKPEVAVNAAMAYWPSIACGASTALCIAGMSLLDKKKQASLVSACGFLSNYHKEYVDALISLHGQEADDEVKAELTRTNCAYHQISPDDSEPKYIWYDDTTGESFVKSEKEVMDAEYHFNRNFVMRGLYATVNDWRDMLGLPRKEEFDAIGWCGDDGLYWVDFEHYPLNHDAVNHGAMPKVCISAVFPADTLDDCWY